MHLFNVYKCSHPIHQPDKVFLCKIRESSAQGVCKCDVGPTRTIIFSQQCLISNLPLEPVTSSFHNMQIWIDLLTLQVGHLKNIVSLCKSTKHMPYYFTARHQVPIKHCFLPLVDNTLFYRHPIDKDSSSLLKQQTERPYKQRRGSALPNYLLSIKTLGSISTQSNISATRLDAGEKGPGSQEERASHLTLQFFQRNTN